MKQEFTVIYEGGREQQVAVTMGDLSYAEIRLAKDGIEFRDAQLTGSIYAIYHRLRRNGDVAEPFENWMERIDKIDAPEQDKSGDDSFNSFTG